MLARPFMKADMLDREATMLRVVSQLVQESIGEVIVVSAATVLLEPSPVFRIMAVFSFYICLSMI